MGTFARVLALLVASSCGATQPARAADPPPDTPSAAPGAQASVPSTAGSRDPSRAECLAAHEQAQDSRLAGQLLAARSALRLCSAVACPSLVSRDCVTWLEEVQTQLPTVIFRAAKDGDDVIQLRVREGERVLTESLTGSPLELDPGPHHFIAELPGFPPQAATYVLTAGDKARVVRFDFVSKAAAPPPTTAPPPPPRPAPASVTRPVPALTYALGGATLAATLTGVVLGGVALSERSDAKKRCAPLCSNEDVLQTRRLALASDIAFGAALLGAGLTLYSYAHRPEVASPSPPTSAAKLRLSWTGSAIAASGRF